MEHERNVRYISTKGIKGKNFLLEYVLSLCHFKCFALWVEGFLFVHLSNFTVRIFRAISTWNIHRLIYWYSAVKLINETQMPNFVPEYNKKNLERTYDASRKSNASRESLSTATWSGVLPAVSFTSKSECSILYERLILFTKFLI